MSCMIWRNTVLKAFVTGGTGTIGALVIKELTNLGYEVFFQYGQNDECADILTDKYGAKGFKILFDSDNINMNLELWGIPPECDILVNCVGAHVVVKNAESVSIRNIEYLFKTNVEIPFLFIRHMLPYMKARRHGKIINVSSICGLSVGENNIPYILSKHALSALTKCIAEEYKSYGIRCNEICPSAIRSKMNDKILYTEAQMYGVNINEYIKLEQPNGTLEPQSVVNAISFLISDKADEINGISLVIDGSNNTFKGEN